MLLNTSLNIKGQMVNTWGDVTWFSNSIMSKSSKIIVGGCSFTDKELFNKSKSDTDPFLS